MVSGNKRILIVDDQDDLREQLAKLLLRSGKKNETSSLVEQMRNRLQGTNAKPAENGQGNTYDVITAGQGEDAYELVKKAVESHEPYAVMFTDMRMPPGWDGLETAKKIRDIDKNIEIVIMTAYADHDQSTIAETVGTPEKLLYIKKPFQSEEIYQLALCLTSKWNSEEAERSRKDWLENLIRCMSKVKTATTSNLDEVYSATLKAIMSFAEAAKGFIGVYNELAEQWTVTGVSNYDESEAANYFRENGRKLAESRTTQVSDGKYLLPLRRDKLFAMAVVEDFQSYTDPEWYKLFSVLVMTASEVLNNSILAADNIKKEQLSALGVAVSKISHESKNMLNYLLNYASMLRERLDGNNADLAEEILDVCEKMLKQMNQILLFSNNAPIADPEEGHLELILHDVCDSSMFGERKLEVKAACTGLEDAPFMGKPELIDSVFRNLVLNSLDAAEGAGMNKIDIKMNLAGEGDNYRVTYEDNGPGIPDKISRTMFEPFVTAGKEHGFGLGLAIVKQIISKHQGKIFHDTSYKDGARFVVILPKPKA